MHSLGHERLPDALAWWPGPELSPSFPGGQKVSLLHSVLMNVLFPFHLLIRRLPCILALSGDSCGTPNVTRGFAVPSDLIAISK